MGVAVQGLHLSVLTVKKNYMKRFLLANVKLLYGYVISIPAWVLPYPARLHRPALRFLISSLAFFICLAGIAQEKKSTPVTEDYKKVLRERSAKIVNTIGLTFAAIFGSQQHSRSI